MIHNSHSRKNVILMFVLLLGSAAGVCAQSIDPAAPTPVRRSSLLGRIAPRDLGDSRLTDHYYAFTGTPGDLLITVQSRNLNGDIDVFTAGTMRPLLKLTLYAENAKPVTKGIYLRRREDLILRIEARSPNDDEGTYQLSFTGSFEPILGGPDIAEAEAPASGATPPTASADSKTKRVTSVGARIAEPPPPPAKVAAAPTPEPKPEATPKQSPAPAEKPSNAPRTAVSPRPARPRQPASRRATPTPAPTKPTATTAEEKKNAEAPKEAAATESKPKVAPRTSARRSGTPAPPAKPPAGPAAEPEPEIGPRLIIETSDGTLINRSMSGVRRLTVENGQIVVVGKDGKIDRIQLANVVRMSIAP